MLIRTVRFDEGPLFSKVEDIGNGHFRLLEKFNPEWREDKELSNQMVSALFLPNLCAYRIWEGQTYLIEEPPPMKGCL